MEVKVLMVRFYYTSILKGRVLDRPTKFVLAAAVIFGHVKVHQKISILSVTHTHVVPNPNDSIASVSRIF